MTNEIQTRHTDPAQVPKLANGLTPLLSELLDSRALSKHRAMVGFEQEVLAKKVDRFGGDRDGGSPAHDRMVTDWMDALQDYPLGEVQAACRAAIFANPNKMPNEGHVKAQIIKARALACVRIDTPEPAKQFADEGQKARANDIMAAFNKGKSFPKVGEGK